MDSNLQKKSSLEDHKHKYHESSLKPQAVAVDDKCEDEGDSKASIEKDGNNPKRKYEDKLNSNDDDRDAKEEEDICSRTSAKEITLDSTKAEENVTRVCCEKASSSETDVSDHRAAIHNDISPSHKAIKNHNCETCHQGLISKKRLKKHIRKKHIAADKQTNESCEKPVQESKPDKPQQHEEGSEDKGHEIETAGEEVNHGAEEKDNIEDESMVHNDDEAFEGDPGKTLHLL